ncbi:hypothetical protein ACVIWV_002441 [Bradyrhizobium diazoefficiens]|uniref:hypothetical protein n=1 Tax=Bradyrhizobium TaxID=374 RepID=UPI000A617436|nr:hypothetical protein [Bradyrhizobium diazoefficiens]MBR0865941.1 hypothetical protein [Bradyrhizobium diazoefficiens]MBR0890472.1 hypothetical protein [Bradyrhizobium diazoefficiens]MBR0922241.1 hypothetical protein [Bradyrhizobium diazoefficiens]
MIIFPFGFYTLEGKRPIYVGNDIEAQKTARAWIEAPRGSVKIPRVWSLETPPPDDRRQRR